MSANYNLGQKVLREFDPPRGIVLVRAQDVMEPTLLQPHRGQCWSLMKRKDHIALLLLCLGGGKERNIVAWSFQSHVLKHVLDNFLNYFVQECTLSLQNYIVLNLFFIFSLRLIVYNGITSQCLGVLAHWMS